MLLLVPTPIGNLEDVTYRAVRIMKEADLIACEDTRTSGVFLNHYGIDTPRTSYHEHNERKKAPQLIERMRAGGRVVLISDAGTPGISDPGFYLVRECLREEIPVEALPGPTAFVPALVASGLPVHRFVFEGFLPVKKGRKTRIESLSSETRTLVLYESPHRLVRTLRDLSVALGPDRPCVVCRELTKLHEEYSRGTLADVLEDYESRARIRGEIVLIVSGE